MPIFNIIKKSLLRYYTTTSGHVYTLEKLNNRCIVRVSGPDVSEFLQGLLTNDLTQIQNSTNGSMYSMFLNPRGRILYDTLIYKPPDKDTFLLDCDSLGVDGLEKLLKIYKLRKQITFHRDDINIYVLFNADIFSKYESISSYNNDFDHVDKFNGAVIDDISIYRDPRIPELGLRILTSKTDALGYKLSDVLYSKIVENTDVRYKTLRYFLGVGEGIQELPPNESLPFEANVDYLQGVNFHKGCYVGQELTARTYYTGVIRKRLMPIFLDKPLKSLPVDNSLIHNGKNLGKLRGVNGTYGLGLLRIADVLDIGEFKIGSSNATTRKPYWWPKEESSRLVNN